MDKRFDSMDQRLDSVDRRLKSVEQKIQEFPTRTEMSDAIEHLAIMTREGFADLQNQFSPVLHDHGKRLVVIESKFAI